MREESSTMRLHNENNEPWSRLVRAKGKTYRHVQFYQWSDPEALIKIHLSVIRPHLEYAAPVWSPDLIKGINKLEHVQKFALRVYTKQWNIISYKDLLEKCHVSKLTTRRDHLSLGCLHRIDH